METFRGSILIDASAKQVWQILVDVGNWPKWNETVAKVTGSVALGSKIAIFAKLRPERAFSLRVSEFMSPFRMVWLSGMPFGLFRGKRTYRVTWESSGRTRFEMTEEFSGLMAPLISGSIPDLQQSFDEFASCLKKASEQQAQPSKF